MRTENLKRFLEIEKKTKILSDIEMNSLLFNYFLFYFIFYKLSSSTDTVLFRGNDITPLPPSSIPQPTVSPPTPSPSILTPLEAMVCKIFLNFFMSF